MFDESDEVRVGIVVRNSLGEVMSALSEVRVEILELLAAKHVVKFV